MRLIYYRPLSVSPGLFRSESYVGIHDVLDDMVRTYTIDKKRTAYVRGFKHILAFLIADYPSQGKAIIAFQSSIGVVNLTVNRPNFWVYYFGKP